MLCYSFLMGGKWPNKCFMGWCVQDLFKTACSILVWFPSSFFIIHLVSIPVVYPYSSIDTTTAWKKFCFISMDTLDFHIINSLSKVFHAFSKHILTSLLINEVLLSMYMNGSTNFSYLEWRLLFFLFKYSFMCIRIDANAFDCLL